MLMVCNGVSHIRDPLQIYYMACAETRSVCVFAKTTSSADTDNSKLCYIFSVVLLPPCIVHRLWSDAIARYTCSSFQPYYHNIIILWCGYYWRNLHKIGTYYHPGSASDVIFSTEKEAVFIFCMLPPLLQYV